MTVSEIMNREIVTCTPHEDLSAAAKRMRDHGCGFVPVVDTHGAVVGVLTDRDVCLFASERGRSMSHMSVLDAMSRPVFNCLVDDNVKTSLATMAKHQVRRLPVIDRNGHVVGVLSIDDIIRAPRRRGGPTADEILGTLKAVTAPRPIAVPA